MDLHANGEDDEVRFTPDPDYLDWWESLTPAERITQSAKLWEIVLSLTPSEQRTLMMGDDTLLPGEFRWRLAHYVGKSMPDLRDI